MAPITWFLRICDPDNSAAGPVEPRNTHQQASGGHFNMMPAALASPESATPPVQLQGNKKTATCLHVKRMPGLPTVYCTAPSNAFGTTIWSAATPAFVDLDTLPSIGHESSEDAYVYRAHFY